MQIALRSHTGRVRSHNEDSYYAQDALLLVADGMGGHRGGKQASQTAVDVIAAQYQLVREKGEDFDIPKAITLANVAICQKAADDAALSGMGTTVTLCHVRDNIAVLGHVGDSRAYMMRNGRLSRLTRDHSLVEELVRNGSITPEEALHHPLRHMINRALGAEGGVRVDSKRIGIAANDILLLCSDGLIIHVDDGEIGQILAAEKPLEEQADQLLELALSRGGDDNVTIVLAKVEGSVSQ